ncbi:MAG: HipA domain-containing protein [Ruminococcus sp.]|jgi:hypothetical protein|nr:HipA domain-containing protein [Ruminococcus sp.]
MHKRTPVAAVCLHADTGYIEKVLSVFDKAHLPVGTVLDDGLPERADLNSWWSGRSIPASRSGIREALGVLGAATTGALIDKCYGLSLSDQYWMKPENADLSWDSINFFENDFSKDVGEILFGNVPEGEINLFSPDNTSDGWLRKKWIIADGKRFLKKGGSGVFEQEPCNEVIAAAICRRLAIPHANYTLSVENGKTYSLSENFISKNTELIPAWRIAKITDKRGSESKFAHFLRCAEEIGQNRLCEPLYKMLVLDYIIMNEDRHFGNFGAVRNAETLKWIGFAPIYDSGTSLWYDTQRVGEEREAKPFCKTHIEQIKLVRDFSWIPENAFSGLSDEITDILSNNPEIDPERAKKIAENVLRRAEKISRL